MSELDQIRAALAAASTADESMRAIYIGAGRAAYDRLRQELEIPCGIPDVVTDDQVTVTRRTLIIIVRPFSELPGNQLISLSRNTEKWMTAGATEHV